MLWVSWRQHRTQAIVCLALFCAFAIFAIAAGAWMRTTFSHDGLATCLADLAHPVRRYLCSSTRRLAAS
jgi:hypothetical protein